MAWALLVATLSMRAQTLRFCDARDVGPHVGELDALSMRAQTLRFCDSSPMSRSRTQIQLSMRAQTLRFCDWAMSAAACDIPVLSMRAQTLRFCDSFNDVRDGPLDGRSQCLRRGFVPVTHRWHDLST